MSRFTPVFLSTIGALFLLAYPGGAQTTTHTNQAGNNTSACSGYHLPDVYCQGPFGGMYRNTSHTYEPVPGHVSPLSVHQLLYPGNTTKVFVNLLPWFTVVNLNASSY